MAIILSIILVFIALFCRLFYLMLFKSPELQVKASEEWFRDLPLSAKRGEILDCNGIKLATSVTTYDVYVRARNVKDKSGVASLLSNTLNLDFDSVYAKVTNTSIGESLIKLQVDEDIALSLVNSGLKGIYLSQNVKRYYPYSDMLTQVLGYCTIDSSGQAGLESFYDLYLKGIPGKTLSQTTASGEDIENTLTYYIPSIDGVDMKLTIDIYMQTAMETALNNAMIEHNAKKAYGIILDAETGGIKAMTVKPSFDLNNPDRTNLSILNELSKNSCVVDVYEPGSTFKILTLAAALNEGLVSVDDKFYCNGSTTVDGQRIKCWKTTGHGSQTLQEAFKNSCNCCFVQLASKLGVETFYKYLQMFGIGNKTGVDIASESSGLMLDESVVTNVDLARIGFGQAVAVTPLQLIYAVSGILTGKFTTPHLIDSLYNSTGEIYKYSVSSSNNTLNTETIEILRDFLRLNINQSEDELTFVAGYDVGGKTGTAQKYIDGSIASGKYVSSFIGVYPCDNPKYIMIVCVDEPSNGAYYGGVVAKPIGQQVFQEIFTKLNFLPDDENSLTIKKDVEMPNLIGLPISKAGAILKGLGLNYDVSGTGGYVVSQIPSYKTMLYKNEDVLLVTT